MFKLLYLIVFFFISINAYAGCFVNGGQYSGYVSFGTVYVQRDTPVGSSVAFTDISYSRMYTCNDRSYYEYFDPVTYTQSSGTPAVFKTNIPGIGIKIEVSNRGGVPQMYGPFSANDYGQGSYWKFNLIKLSPGAVNGGSLTNGQVGHHYLTTGVNVAVINLYSTTIVPVLCSITTPNLIFPIGDVLASKFGTSVGTIPSGAQNTQNLGLNCDANANINVTLSGTQNADVSDTSVLALTGQGSSDVASGVGVQLLYNNSPLKLNNRIVLKKSSGGQETFPLVARYYQTKSTVTTGKANASATLDLTYQ
ncbi:fimbrial protein [Cronobacter turicensis]|uniref:fimbrial protein n=1 Tax=Cronobacter turicensis TaxID=413502 RepID=UPI002937DAC1|nr:fimbrial protein [Cronobacter turicensis]